MAYEHEKIDYIIACIETVKTEEADRTASLIEDLRSCVDECFQLLEC